MTLVVEPDDRMGIGLRWYLARAKDGYLAETASYFSANDADLVVVVEDGVISEFGLHERHCRDRGFVRRALGLLARERLRAAPETPHPAQGR